MERSNPQPQQQASETPKIPDEIRIGNSPPFAVLEKLGEGGYGAVHKGVRTRIKLSSINCPKEVAIKFELSDEEPDEWEFIDALQGIKGIPEVYYKGKCGGYWVTIMELLGCTFRQKWFTQVKKKGPEDESKEWLLEKSVECIEILEKIHERGIIHGDVKPENIVMGRPGTPEEDQIYFVDFGLAARYKNNNKHTEYDQDLDRFYGTTRYASVHAHLGRIVTRRDDLESLAYTFSFLLNGYVYWGADEQGEHENYNVCKKKMEGLPAKLMGSRRSPFKHFFQLVIDLKFDEDPDYELMKSVFRMKMQNPNKRVRTATHIDLTHKDFNKRFVLGKNVHQFVSIWTEKDYPPEQQLILSAAEGELESVMRKVYKDKYIVSHAVYGDGKWNLVCNKFADFTEQIWFFTEPDENLMPMALLNRYFKEGYCMTTVACDPNGRGLFFMLKDVACGNQRFDVQDEFPYEWICDNWNDGYHVISMCSSWDGKKWAVVMAMGTGYEDQVVEFDFMYPSEGIHKRWEQGYHITCAAGNSDGCVFVLSIRQGEKMLLPPVQRSLRTCDLGNSIDKHMERLQKNEKTFLTALCFGRTIC